MIVKDAFEACFPTTVLDKLLEQFPEEVSNLIGYQEAMDEIYVTEPVESEFKLKMMWYPSDDDSGELYLYTNCVKSDEVMGYSIMGMTWEEVLGAQVPKYLLDEFSNKDIASNCLFEMTFMGYSNKDAQREMSKIVGYKNDYLERHQDES